MPRYGAFLRAINVGGHTVRMSALRASFEALGFAGVETVLASGNVTFETGETDQSKLERTIERALESDLGYPVETFVRSLDELAEIAKRNPFGGRPSSDDKRSVYVAFLGRKPASEAAGRLSDLATDDDSFAVVAREAYWLRRGGIGTSRFSGGLLEKTLGMPATLRGLPTLARIVAKLRLKRRRAGSTHAPGRPSLLLKGAPRPQTPRSRVPGLHNSHHLATDHT